MQVDTKEQQHSNLTPRPGSHNSRVDLGVVEQVFADFLEKERWCVWEYFLRDGKWEKLPIDAKNGNPAKADDPSTWSDYQTARKALKSGKILRGLGIYFHSDSMLSGTDSDDSYNPASGEFTPLGSEILQLMYETYKEISPSRTGFKCFHLGKMVSSTGCKDNKIGLELYDHGRFFTITGEPVPGSPLVIANCEAEFRKLETKYFASKTHNKSNGHDKSGFWRGDIPNGSRHDSIRDRIYKWRMLGMPQESVLKLALDAAKLLGKHDAKEIERLVIGAFEKYPTIHSPEDITDMRNGARYAERFRESLLYSHPQKSWLYWTSKNWSLDQIGVAISYAKELMQETLEGSQGIAEEEIRRKVRARIVQFESHARIEAMVNLARSCLPVLPGDFDPNPWLFNCQNGTLNLEKGQLQEHRRTDLITKISPVFYDLEAQCPLFIDFLKEILADSQTMFSFLQQFFGYCLTGLANEKIFPIFWGSGDNGKTTLIKVIQHVVGDYAMQGTMEMLLQKKNEDPKRTDLADLKGARFVPCVESAKGRQLDEVVIKQLTGRDKVRARHNYERFFEFLPECKVIMVTNNKPVIRGIDRGIWNRVQLVPFNVVIPKDRQDLNLEDKLKAEASGILNWMLDGVRRWQKSGLQIPDEVSMATEIYRERMDVIGRFIAECCTVCESFQTGAFQFYKAYEDWCARSNELKLEPNEFSEAMIDRGFTKKRKPAGVAYLGLGLNIDEKTL